MNVASALAQSDPVAGRGARSFGLDLASYDRHVKLTPNQLQALVGLGPARLRRGWARGGVERIPLWDSVSGLVGPLDDARAMLHHPDEARYRRAGAHAAGVVLERCADSGRSYWEWTEWEWARLCGGSAEEFVSAQTLPTETTLRPFLIALGCLLGGFTGFHHLGTFNRLHLAGLVFGLQAVEDSMRAAGEVLDQWGYRSVLHATPRWHGVFSQALLINGSPRLQDLSSEAFARLRAHPATSEHHGTMLFALQRAVAALGHCDPPVRTGRNAMTVIEGADAAWIAWVERWYATSTLTPKVRAIVRTLMAKAGRWLATEHPEITEPTQWTRTTCATWVAAVDRMCVGDYVQRRDGLGGRAGTPISPRTKAHALMACRTFFRDCQEWEWLPRRFDPSTALSVPRSVAALIGTNPRVIADEVWAKLLWAGLNIEQDDLPGTRANSFYPLELVRAVTLTWLFSGLRSDELSRLRVGCVRWQHQGQPIPGDSPDVLAADAVCLLDVPVHKTGTAFTKPVDPLVGQAIEAWQALRPEQPQTLDPKTNEHVDMLFAVRTQRVARNYINRTIIPALCGKAGVPTSDVRGNITSHRARSTIASQLYNAKEPMTLFELQAWLGHRTPNTTQHYAKITPNTLTKAYTEAGYFARNMRTIEVLIDRDAVTSGAAADGEPWQHYDLGHGWCTYTFFEQCPHRMACAHCDFYTPKGSAKGQLLEAKENLERMLTSIPLSDDERAAVDDGQAALDSLLSRLTDVPTPSGSTPREIGIPPTATLLPIIEINHATQRQSGQI
jgi:integrase